MMQMLKERWRHFSPRERIIVAAGGAMAAAVLVFLLIIDPVMATIDKTTADRIIRAQGVAGAAIEKLRHVRATPGHVTS